jgi:hypothetical protein
MIMTRLPGVPNREDVKPGMAHYAGSGPAGMTCGDCAYRSYWRPGKDKVNPRTRLIETTQKRTLGCREYRRLTGQHGPAVMKEWAACSYFSAKRFAKKRAAT